MKLQNIKNKLSLHKKEIQKKYYVKTIGIFGSYTKGKQSKKSDIDILVEFEKPIGLDFVDLADYLQSLLKIKVHLASKGAINSERWEYLKDDLIYV